MRSMWLNIVLGILDAILHYLEKKGVVEFESKGSEEEG